MLLGACDIELLSWSCGCTQLWALDLVFEVKLSVFSLEGGKQWVSFYDHPRCIPQDGRQLMLEKPNFGKHLASSRKNLQVISSSYDFAAPALIKITSPSSTI